MGQTEYSFFRIGNVIILLIAFIAVIYLASCKKEVKMKKLEVTATAYNSLKGQAHGHPVEAAWGDTLKSGMKAIAVSRDLIDSGLTHNTEVKIEGLPGNFSVLDKMNKRWKKKIDIYMGTSELDAKEWGKRKVTIKWKVQEDE
ncbi:MAG: 3D domain-containing protein [Bacteroidota bacterium]